MSELPRGWANASVSGLTDYVQRGKSPHYSEKSDLPVVNQKCIRWWGIDARFLKFVAPEQWDAWGSERTLRPGDILWNSTGTGTIGRAAIFSTLQTFARVVADSHVTVVRTNSAVESRYLLRFIQSPIVQSRIEDMQSGSTNQVELGREEVLGTEVPLPPLPEQRRIVAKIDSLAAKSARARDRLDHIPRLVEKYKQAILAAAFRGELTTDWRSRNPACINVEAIRRERAASILNKRREKALAELPARGNFEHCVPATWRWVSVEELASDEPRSIQSGPFGSALLHSEFVPQGRLVIGIDNVQDGYFDKGSQNRITDAKFSELTRFAARPADVLITVMATIGRVCVLPADLEQSIITKHVYRITIDDRFALPNFVAFGLRGSEAALNHMGANVRGQTRPGLNGEVIKNLFLPVPPLAEQREVVRRIETAFTWIDRLAKEATSARKLVDHLDQAVLAKAFRGELVPQDPSDEPASVLLERIKAERGASVRVKRARRSPAEA